MKDIFNKIAVFEELFDVVRIVDPIRKKVLDIKNTKIKETEVWTELNCHDFWNKENCCENCISMRSMISKKEEIKFEFDGLAGYLITAKIFKINGNDYIMEFVKKLDRATIIKELETDSSEDIGKIIEKINSELMIDPLTSIYNKRFVTERLPHELAYSILENKSICFSMADIDFFKNVNDQYGHLCGDMVLEKFAQILDSNLNKPDEWVARFGGEEFVIVLKGRTEDECFEILENMRKNVENYEFTWENKIFGITVSLGALYIKNVDTHNGEGIKKYIDMADKNMYRAKETGRNRVVYTSV